MNTRPGVPHKGTVETPGRKRNSAAKRTGWKEETNKT